MNVELIKGNWQVFMSGVWSIQCLVYFTFCQKGTLCSGIYNHNSSQVNWKKHDKCIRLGAVIQSGIMILHIVVRAPLLGGGAERS